MTNKALSSLGMAMRAGKVVTGDDTVLKTVRQGKAALVLVAADASDNTKKKYRDKCATYGVFLAEAFSRDALGHALGKEERVVIAVTDAGFANMIRGRLSQNTEVENID
ncbi:ribosomal L7Ae/L30e/S12e/Gadd45 family protein [Paenibacillus pasadenensis]|uniref:L7Ae/L30e/S12e/Gadd45 family ribosomal protein n=1 Tax=Paenibacillus pasadenensis TaxID=217090 RepID=UPI00203CB591|nr:ribosomal L7Ae/L30e/S12e/Gadd45 family protein [Paenibacillus pasadenensis]MCM3745967.1 ribosomal L7Ae/L30e/S12e/Gadd45 family protein [Paenibacillus pasadenensis]